MKNEWEGEKKGTPDKRQSKKGREMEDDMKEKNR